MRCPLQESLLFHHLSVGPKRLMLQQQLKHLEWPSDASADGSSSVKGHSRRTVSAHSTVVCFFFFFKRHSGIDLFPEMRAHVKVQKQCCRCRSGEKLLGCTANHWNLGVVNEASQQKDQLVRSVVEGTGQKVKVKKFPPSHRVPSKEVT